ncbi:IS110 family transposase [Bacteroidia bacterium]|nr:IS110 family transposase [Bacteroidia bacterium]
MEATGVYYEGLAYFLFAKKADFRVFIVLPNQSKAYGKSLGIKSKTDRIDAKILAQMGLERALRLWKPISPELLVLKQFTRERNTLVRSKTTAANHLHAITHQGKPNKSSIGRTERHIKFLNKQIKEIEKEIKLFVNQDVELNRKLEFLTSIPGVGLLTAATTVAETNRFASINSIKQLTSYAGLDVKLAESGTWRGKNRISKCGNSHIRKALYMPSLSNIVYDKINRKCYERIQENNKLPMIALVAVERKMLGLMYTLWKNETMYDVNY